MENKLGLRPPNGLEFVTLNYIDDSFFVPKKDIPSLTCTVKVLQLVGEATFKFIFG